LTRSQSRSGTRIGNRLRRPLFERIAVSELTTVIARRIGTGRAWARARPPISDRATRATA
jgi:hypothetical protein